MKSLDEIQMVLQRQKPMLEKKYGLKALGIFGSYVRGEQKITSDLDVLLEFSMR